jgi:hypothetical protein
MVRFCAVPAQERSLCLSIDQSCLNKLHRQPVVCLSVQHEQFPERIHQTLRDHTHLAASACDETGQSRLGGARRHRL